MQPLVPLIAALVYILMLFSVAAFADARRRQLPALRRHAYALALGVYCTSWTYYGAVGTAVAQGWTYLAIYLGPLIVYIGGGRFLGRLTRAVKADGATSISDFIGGRFRKSQGVAALVTLLALLGSIPYIALQLRSVGTSFALLSGERGEPLIIAITATALGAFAMLFGTRRYDAAARNDGLLYAVAIESVIKLAALVVVAWLAWSIVSPGQFAIWHHAAQALTLETVAGFDPAAFAVSLVLSMAAILCLPRQFYIGVIEAGSAEDPFRARSIFAAYLIATMALVLPIAFAGMTLLPPATRPDVFVIELPLHLGQPLIALIVFVGGFSAATAMVIVETIALSTMVSNDFVTPLLLRWGFLAEDRDVGRWMLTIRRLAIAAIMGVALLWALNIGERASLAAIGLVAFAAMAQFAPALIMATVRRDNDPVALKAGLAAGLIVWSWTLAWPQVLPPAWLAQLKGQWIDPFALAGIGGMSPIVHGTMWSLGSNLLAFGLVAMRRLDARAALPFGLRGGATATDMAQLSTLVERFVGRPATEAALGVGVIGEPIDQRSALAAERLIAGVIGAPSARALMRSTLLGASLSPGDVARLLDESGQSLQFSKDLLAATLENIHPAVSVVDHNLNLVAWNGRYLNMFAFPPGMVRVGAPVADLIRINAARGECGPGEVEAHVAKRLDHMRAGRVHSFERVRPDGRVLKTVGGPMPGRGYVMCFTDVTEEAQAKAALERARDELEQRVDERTAALREANRALAAVNRDKTRFLAAASHDLMQPLHAARLFSAALARDVVDERQAVLLTRIDRAIHSADELLQALLDISRLDTGGVVPKPVDVPLNPLLAQLADEMRPLAEARGLRLAYVPTGASVRSDPLLLRLIVRNFLSNAVRYTPGGGIVMGVRRKGDEVRVDVVDSGIGIAESKFGLIFREFERLGTAADGGVGLGLAIVQRSAHLLGAPLSLQSREGKGSRFSILLPHSGTPNDGPDANGPVAGFDSATK